MPSRNICREGDGASGHSCFPPRNNVEGHDTVFANGIGVHLKGMGWDYHTCGDNTHNSVLAEGSSSVFVGGIPVGRVADPVACGSVVANGSPNVYAGG